ncbi:MAG: hypothetical protein HYY37_04695 [Candidatus Aenigmarchaeota archaeon]|nr:hypothetical protein [Candidatus Aenigmarchaeota archaeon]
MPAYGFAIHSVFGYDVQHEKVISFRHGNNIIENFWRCKRSFPGFRAMKSAKKFIDHWMGGGGRISEMIHFLALASYVYWKESRSQTSFFKQEVEQYQMKRQYGKLPVHLLFVSAFVLVTLAAVYWVVDTLDPAKNPQYAGARLQFSFQFMTVLLFLWMIIAFVATFHEMLRRKKTTRR